MTTAAAAAEAATTSAVEPLSYRGRPDGAAAARTAEIFERHGPTVLGLCRMLLRNEHEAEDASQQTFLAAYRSILNGVEPRHPAAWLATIARNECWAAIERRMRAPVHQGELEAGSPTRSSGGRRTPTSGSSGARSGSFPGSSGGRCSSASSPASPTPSSPLRSG